MYSKKFCATFFEKDQIKVTDFECENGKNGDGFASEIYYIKVHYTINENEKSSGNYFAKCVLTEGPLAVFLREVTNFLFF